MFFDGHYAAESEVEEKVESEWAFRTDKGVEVSRGASAKEAWTALGYEGINMDYLPRAEAEAQGWFEEAKGNPLDL